MWKNVDVFVGRFVWGGRFFGATESWFFFYHVSTLKPESQVVF